MHNTSAIVFLLIGLAALGAGCSDSGGGSDPEPEPALITKTLTAEDRDNNETLGNLTIVSGSDTLAEGVSTYEAQANKNTRRPFTISSPNYQAEQRTITFSSGQPVTFRLTRTSGEPVTIAFSTGEQQLAATLIYKRSSQPDSTVAEGKASGQFTLPFSQESGQLCANSTGAESEECKQVTPNQDQELAFALEAQIVALTITPQVAGKTALRREVNDQRTSYELTVGGETFTNTGPDGQLMQIGEPVRVEVPVGTAEISGRFIYRDERNRTSFDGHDLDHWSLAEGTLEQTIDAETSVTLELEHIPACADGISNDVGPAVDDEDGGCMADNSPSYKWEDDTFVYDAADDDERALLSGSTFGSGTFDRYFVSSAEGERRRPLGGHDFPERLTYGSGPILFFIYNKIEKSQSGETASIELKCKPMDSNAHMDTRAAYSSNEIADDPKVDGWRWSETIGISTDVLRSEGRNCDFQLQHGTLARGEPAGDGNDDFVVENSEQSSSYGYRIAIELENLPARFWLNTGERASTTSVENTVQVLE